ncbi:MAG: class I SAM-dependent methyltransferase [Mangrovibacterium sp.]
MPQGSLVLDLGCGTGIPISKVLIDAGMIVYGIDASPTLINEFRRNFPNNPVACEPAENSSFFTCKFDAIISWGIDFPFVKRRAGKGYPKSIRLFANRRKVFVYSSFSGNCMD